MHTSILWFQPVLSQEFSGLKRDQNIKLMDYKLKNLVDWTISCNSFWPGVLLCSTGHLVCVTIK